MSVFNHHKTSSNETFSKCLVYKALVKISTNLTNRSYSGSRKKLFTAISKEGKEDLIQDYGSGVVHYGKETGVNSLTKTFFLTTLESGFSEPSSPTGPNLALYPWPTWSPVLARMLLGQLSKNRPRPDI